FGEDHLTYGRLDTEANRLAHHLRDTTGLGRGDLAGILVDRSLPLATAILAVLKTGAAYTLLDPDYPDLRLTRTGTDAGITALLTAGEQCGRLTGPWPEVPFDRLQLPELPDNAPGIAIGPEDPACVMFTSGSTGRPKGILSSHRNLTSTVTGQTYCTFGPGETFL
ncbi:amino acid adenylation protein, partial [Streptomyces tsukubensis]